MISQWRKFILSVLFFQISNIAQYIKSGSKAQFSSWIDAIIFYISNQFSHFKVEDIHLL